MLVSDGGENEKPWIADVTPMLISKGVIVNAFLLSNHAEKTLVRLAAFTKGTSYFDSESRDSTELQSAFRATVQSSDSESPGSAPVEVSRMYFHNAMAMEELINLSFQEHVGSIVPWFLVAQFSRLCKGGLITTQFIT